MLTVEFGLYTFSHTEETLHLIHFDKNNNNKKIPISSVYKATSLPNLSMAAWE